MKSYILIFFIALALTGCESCERQIVGDTVCGEILLIRIDDDAEYHITAELETELRSFSDIEPRVFYDTISVPKLCITPTYTVVDEYYSNTIDTTWTQHELKVFLPRGYYVNTFDD